MRAVTLVTRESFLLLRRDKIFIPAAIAGVVVALFANVASEWGIEEFSKILFDVGALGFHLTGSLVAIFWGTRTVSEARADGSLEIQLAAPIGRVSWLTGKYLGLVLALVWLWVMLVVFWQVLMMTNNFGLMSQAQVTFFVFQLLEWCIVGALALFYSTFAGVTIAIFASITTWMIGLVSLPVYQALPPGADRFTTAIVEGVARFWNLRQFNLASYATGYEKVSFGELQLRGAYGLLLILIIMSVSCVVFRRRDVMA
jgi:Cu-processing system permease protein